jgi:LysM repeat protein
VKPENGPAQIRIEPRPDDKLESDVHVKKVDTPEKKDDLAPAKNKTSGGRTKVYVVKRGDTLTALAKECGLTVQELATLNGKSVKKLSNLWVGQKIRLPAAE